MYIAYSIFFGYVYIELGNIWTISIIHFLNNNMAAILYGTTGNDLVFSWKAIIFNLILFSVVYGSLNSKEEITAIPKFINENYFLFYTEIDKENLEYDRYLNHGYAHYDHAIYLCDLNEEEVYFIKDFRIITSMGVEHITELPTFVHNNEEYLILGENYCDDWEYEDIYKFALKNEIDKSKLGPEVLYYIKVDDFIDNIKLGKENISLQVIGKKHLDGWIRYFYSDKDSVYYREKGFSTQKEKIIRLDGDTLNTITVIEIDHSKIEGRVIYDKFSGIYKIYEEIDDDKEDSYHIKVKGLYNCDCNLDFSIDKYQEQYRESYSFMGLIKAKYIIVSGWYEDEEDNYYDIYYIRVYIADNSVNIDATLKYLEKIEIAINRLRRFSKSGIIPRYYILKKQGYRVVIVEKHLVFYKVNEEEKTVIIYAILDGRREYENLL